MANRLSLQLLLVALTISTLLRPISTSSTLHSPPTTTTPPHSSSSSPPKTTTTGTTSSSAIQPPPQQPKVPSSPPDVPLSQQQLLLENIVSALLDTGDFRHWANLLSAAAANPSTTTQQQQQQLLSTEATLLVPSDEALSHFPSTPTGASSPMMMISFDPFLIPYHIIPQRLLFSQLQLFKPLTRLPTLLPSNSILITLKSHSNFSLDDSSITHPDLYVNSAVAVHGIKNVLDYSLYGTAANRPSLLPPPQLITKGPETETLGRKSDAAGFLSDDFTLVFVVVGAAAFAFKI